MLLLWVAVKDNLEAGGGGDGAISIHLTFLKLNAHFIKIEVILIMTPPTTHEKDCEWSRHSVLAAQGGWLPAHCEAFREFPRRYYSTGNSIGVEFQMWPGNHKRFYVATVHVMCTGGSAGHWTSK